MSQSERVRQLRTMHRRERREIKRNLKRKYKNDKKRYKLAVRLKFARTNDLLYDARLDREQLVLPEILSFADNHAATAAILSEIRTKGLVERRPLMLHFSHVKHVEPAATLVLVAEIHRLISLRGQDAVSGTYPREREIYDLLMEMGFFKLIEVLEPHAPKAKSDPDRPIFLRFHSSNRFDTFFPDAFVEIVEKYVVALSTLARGRLIGAIKEAMQNTLDHAYQRVIRGETMEGRWWLSARVNVVQHEVMILLFDQGVGIPETLPVSEFSKLRGFLSERLKLAAATPSDGAMIAVATKLSVSRMPGETRGKGFRTMQQFVETCADGELRVLSNRGSYSYMRGAERFDDHERSIGGTLIEWRFKSDSPVDLKDD